MKYSFILAASLVFTGGCFDFRNSRGNFGEYVVEFPDIFRKFSTHHSTEKRWATQDGTMQIDAFSETRPRKDFDSFSEFETWLESTLAISRPNFFRSANGIRMALSTTEDQTQIVIIHPSHDSEWRASVFHINRGNDNNYRVREIRELAVAAITSGKFAPR